MSNISGTNIAAPIVPFTTDDTYPTHYSKYGVGGWKSVATTADRDAIPAARLDDGSIVYVIAEATAYIWNAGEYTEHASVKFATVEDVAAGIGDDTVVTPETLAPVLNAKASATDVVSLQGKVGVVEQVLDTKADQESLTSALIQMATNIVNIQVILADRFAFR